MKKLAQLALVICPLVLVVSLAGCITPTFNGSRTGNDDRLIMSYSILNTTETQHLNLEAGDVLDVEVTSDEGSVSLVVQKQGSNPVYEGENLPTGSFQIEIEEAGIYRAAVTGDHARGGISITKA